MVARARMIEDVSQRGAPYQATIGVQVAVTDSEYFSVARFSGWMSVMLMSVVFAFFLIGRLSGIASQQVSAEVLAFVLTLFAAVQACGMERPDRLTLRGLLAQASNLLIGILILPTVVLAVALAFSRGLLWVACWALGAIAFQLVLQWLLSQRQRLDTGQQGQTPDALRMQLCNLLRTDTPDYSHAEVLHSTWWRSTTADALLVGPPTAISSGSTAPRCGPCCIVAARPTIRRPRRCRLDRDPSGGGCAARPASSHSQQARRGVAPTVPLPVARIRARPGRAACASPSDGQGGADGEPPASLLEQPASVLGAAAIGTIAQSVTFAVFRDQPKGDWDAATEEVHQVDLDASQLAPASDVSGVVGVFLGLPKDAGPADARRSSGDRRAASRERPQPPFHTGDPAAGARAVRRLHRAAVDPGEQVGLRDGDYARLASFLNDMQALAVGPVAPGLVIGVQTVSEGIPRILNPPPAAANPGPVAEQAKTRPARPVLASDLDVVAGSGLHRTEKASEQTWRLLAICSDWRSAEEIEVLDGLDPGLELACYAPPSCTGSWSSCCSADRPGGRGGHDKALLEPAGKRRSGDRLPGQVAEPPAARGGPQAAAPAGAHADAGPGRGHAGGHRVATRDPPGDGARLADRPGLEGLVHANRGHDRPRCGDPAHGPSRGQPGDHAPAPSDRALGTGGDVPDRASRAGPGRRKMAASGTGSVADLGLDAPEDTVISVSLITTPDLDEPSVSDPGLTEGCHSPLTTLLTGCSAAHRSL